MPWLAPGVSVHLLEGRVRVLFLFIVEGNFELVPHKQKLKEDQQTVSVTSLTENYHTLSLTANYHTLSLTQ